MALTFYLKNLHDAFQEKKQIIRNRILFKQLNKIIKNSKNKEDLQNILFVVNEGIPHLQSLKIDLDKTIFLSTQKIKVFKKYFTKNGK